MAKLISVIMPVYNKQAYVDRAIRSLVEQSYQNLEFLLVNDGSTDGSAEVCKAWAARDARVRYLEQANGGPSAARNTGLAAASGEYIAFLDADDSMRPHALEKMAALMESCRADLVVANQQVNTQTGSRQNTALPGHAGGLLTRDEFDRSLAVYTVDVFWGSQGNKLYRKDLLQKQGIRFDTARRHAEDFLFNLLCFQAMERIAYLNEVTYDIYDVPASLSKMEDIEKVLQWGRDVWEKFDAYFSRPETGKYKADACAFLCVSVSACMDVVKLSGQGSLSAVTDVLKRVGREDWISACAEAALPHTAQQKAVILCYRKHLYGLLGILYWAKHRIK